MLQLCSGIGPRPLARRILEFTFVLISITFALSSCKSKKVPPVPCEVDTTTCQTTLSDGTAVSFSIQPRPVRSMSDLRFEIILRKDGHPVDRDRVSLDFKMPAMYMGENRVALQREEAGRYTGRGSIVKCPSGDRMWDAGITLSRTSEADAVVHFRFEVDR